MTWAIEKKSYSQRRACRLIGLDAKTSRYASRRSGYRRLHILLWREGVALNHKKLFRHNP